MNKFIKSAAKLRMRRWFYPWLLRQSKIRSRQGLYEFLEREYSAIPRQAEVLSIGAGGEVNDILFKVAKRNGFKVTMFDIADARGPDIVGDICDYDFGARQFDVVVISEVLNT
jgi:2-polyprenyl-3-methyl-5-hydroxy-6-metoxy-1,4-benzoquinol methylase